MTIVPRPRIETEAPKEWSVYTKNGDRHGQGKTTYLYGSNHVGKYKEGLFHGQGIFVVPKDFVARRESGRAWSAWLTGLQTGKLLDALKIVQESINTMQEGAGTGLKYIGEFEDNCAKLTASKEDISTFIFPNGDEICLMYDEILNSFKGAGFKIRTGGADNWGPPFQTTLFQVKSAHEVDKFQKILAAKIEKSSHQMIKGGASVHNFGKWDTLVKAIMICRTRDEVASLFHDAYSQISKD